MKIKRLLIMILFIVLILLSTTTVNAASASISATSSEVNVGETVNINVSFTAAAWNITVSGSKISGESFASQTSDLSEATTSKSFSFDTSSAGTYTVTMSGDITDENGNTSKIDKSVTVKVSEKAPDPTPDPTPDSTPDPTPTKSSDTSLKSLTVSPFGSLKAPYDITVDNKYDKVTISAEPNHSGATVSGKIGEFNLEEGTNQFKITVTAEDGTQKTYSVYVRRKVAQTTEPITPPNVIDEKNEDEEKPEENKTEELGLTNLVITGIELNPKFSADVYEYKAEFSEDIDTLEILATPNIEGATFEIVGNSNLKIGENLITIIVKSEDGETTKNYQILVTKNEPETVATTAETGNNVDNNTKKDQELKSKVGKIILIAAAAVIAVILLGIIAIVNTKRKSEIAENTKLKKDKNTFNKNDFRVAVDEEESYRELEKLSNIHNRKNIFENDNNELIEETGHEAENKVENETENEIEDVSRREIIEKPINNNKDIQENTNTKRSILGDEIINKNVEEVTSGYTEISAKENSKTHNIFENTSVKKDNEITIDEETKTKKSKGKRFK